MGEVNIFSFFIQAGIFLVLHVIVLIEFLV